ncbi:hypothetical protein OG21DRAFT_1524609 [Imleria badia]|nr:hypothetical protein OG21DRAFT_1524609 [Imleria badia]
MPGLLPPPASTQPASQPASPAFAGPPRSNIYGVLYLSPLDQAGRYFRLCCISSVEHQDRALDLRRLLSLARRTKDHNNEPPSVTFKLYQQIKWAPLNCVRRDRVHATWAATGRQWPLVDTDVSPNERGTARYMDKSMVFVSLFVIYPSTLDGNFNCKKVVAFGTGRSESLRKVVFGKRMASSWLEEFKTAWSGFAVARDELRSVHLSCQPSNRDSVFRGAQAQSLTGNPMARELSSRRPEVKGVDAEKIAE